MLPELPKQRATFVAHYVETGDHVGAARHAGYKRPHEQGPRLRKELQDHIAHATRERMGNAAPKALQTLIDLSTSARSEAVKLAAAKDLMDRAGYKPADVVQVEHSDKRDDSPRALRAKLQAMLGDTPEGRLRFAILVGEELPPDTPQLKVLNGGQLHQVAKDLNTGTSTLCQNGTGQNGTGKVAPAHTSPDLDRPSVANSG